MPIVCVERVIVAVRDLDAARENWRRAGFGVAPGVFAANGLRIARTAAGAVEIDLCAPDARAADSDNPLTKAIIESVANGGGIIGWTWGSRGDDDSKSIAAGAFNLPGLDGAPIAARILESNLPAVITAEVAVERDIESRRIALAELCGANANTVEYLEHIVVMTPVLEDAIAANEKVGVMCKRIREVGNGARQAFFKLEQTVLEVVGPARTRPGCWGVALMCTDIAEAVATARVNGLQATSPKTAIQGGQIARIVDPLDGVAIAFMQPGPRIDD